MIQGRSEIQRRQKYIEVLESMMTPFHPPLVELVKQCLRNAPHQRPTTDELLTGLRRMKEEMEGRYGSSLVKLDMSKMRLVKELQMKDRRLEEQQVHHIITASLNSIS